MTKHILAGALLLFTCSAHAQDVHVKYRGPVNVDNGHFVEFQLKPSSLVKQIYYDEPNQYLLVSLNGTFYHYCSLPLEVVNDWVNAESLGRYYNANVKGRFDCRINPRPEYR